MNQIPDWLRTLAWLSIAVSLVSSVVIAADLLRGNRQHMWIMNIVWPVTALWAGVVGLLWYFKTGRLASRRAVEQARRRGEDPPFKKERSFAVSTGLGASHCGAGCTLADMIVETAVVFAPVAVFGSTLAGTWLVDYAAAFCLGVAFQYFTIKPMRQLSVFGGIKQALKADVLSLTAWQVGMYGWMAIAIFLIFGREIPKSDPTFWFMMQIAMFAGFAVSYPVNWLLIRKGVKEKM